MSGRYAENTDVTVEKSKYEIERILERYGASAFMYGRDGGRVVIGFRAHDRMVRMELPMPDPNDRVFHKTETGRERKKNAAHKEWQIAASYETGKMPPMLPDGSGR